LTCLRAAFSCAARYDGRMNRPRLFRALRITWSAGFGILCLLVIVMWARSYTWQETIAGSGRDDISVSTLRGSVFINESFNLAIDDPAIGTEQGTIYHTRKPLAGGRILVSSQLDIGYEPRGRGTRFPMWLVVTAVAVVAAAPWFPWSNRFSLRTLLIGTTLVALGLGIAVYFARA
jgi:hypothetical protein